MAKFVDYGQWFLRNISIPLSRFSTEGGEHSNYDHNVFYYRHTTRHGGKKRYDAGLAILHSTWKRLTYEICDIDSAVASQFQHYVAEHVAARKIQAWVRRFLVQKRLKCAGFTFSPLIPLSLGNQVNRDAVVKVHNEMLEQGANVISGEQNLLHRMTFVLSGSAPAFQSKKMSQKSVTELIKSYGGKVSRTIPGSKMSSTKRYTVLVSGFKGKVPQVLKESVRRGYSIVNYEFLYQAIKTQSIPSIDNHVPLFVSKIKFVQRQLSLHQRHFQKQSRMISVIRTARARRQKRKVKVLVTTNPAIFYANSKYRELISLQSKLPRSTFNSLLKQYSMLSSADKAHYISLWKANRTEQQTRKEQISKNNRRKYFFE